MNVKTKRYLAIQKRLKAYYEELNFIQKQARELGCEHIVEERFREWDNGYGRQQKVAYKYCPVCCMEL